jgi:hypothetical protein
VAFLKQIREKVQHWIYRSPEERYTREKDRLYNNNDQDNDRNGKRHATSDRAPFQEKTPSQQISIIRSLRVIPA